MSDPIFFVLKRMYDWPLELRRLIVEQILDTIEFKISNKAEFEVSMVSIPGSSVTIRFDNEHKASLFAIKFSEAILNRISLDEYLQYREMYGTDSQSSV